MMGNNLGWWVGEGVYWADLYNGENGEKGVETVCGCIKRVNVGTRRVKRL